MECELPMSGLNSCFSTLEGGITPCSEHASIVHVVRGKVSRETSDSLHIDGDGTGFAPSIRQLVALCVMGAELNQLGSTCTCRRRSGPILSNCL